MHGVFQSARRALARRDQRQITTLPAQKFQSARRALARRDRQVHVMSNSGMVSIPRAALSRDATLVRGHHDAAATVSIARRALARRDFWGLASGWERTVSIRAPRSRATRHTLSYRIGGSWRVSIRAPRSRATRHLPRTSTLRNSAEFQSARRALARRDSIASDHWWMPFCFNPRAALSRDATSMCQRRNPAAVRFQSRAAAHATDDPPRSFSSRFQSARRALARRDLLRPLSSVPRACFNPRAALSRDATQPQSYFVSYADVSIRAPRSRATRPCDSAGHRSWLCFNPRAALSRDATFREDGRAQILPVLIRAPRSRATRRSSEPDGCPRRGFNPRAALSRRDCGQVLRLPRRTLCQLNREGRFF